MHKFILFGLFLASSAVGVATEDAKFNDPTASSFASDVAVSGDFALVGAAFAITEPVYSYQKIGDDWVFDEKFFAPDGEFEDYFGRSVAMSGDVAIIGAPRDDDPTNGEDSGSAYLFRHDGSDWVFEQKITASDAASNRMFGGAVAISGEVAVVGFQDKTGAPGGTAYVFRYNGTTWVEEKILTASDAVAGDEFGAAVAVSDDVVVVGAPEKSGGGAAYIYRNTTGTTWVEEKILTASDGVEDDNFGDAVAVSGSLAIVGANGHNAAYIYRHTGGSTWDETRITRENGTSGGFGESVAISGEVALVGAAQAESNKGTGHLFRFDGSEWIETVLVPSNPGDFEDPSSNFWFGDSVALSGDYALLGAAFDSGFGHNGAAFLYNLASLTQTVTEAEVLNEGDSLNLFIDNLRPSGITIPFPGSGTPEELISEISLTVVASSATDDVDQDYTFSYEFGEPQVIRFAALEDGLVEDDQTVVVRVTGFIEWIIPGSGSTVFNVLGGGVNGNVEQVAIDLTLSVTINSAPEGDPDPILDFTFVGEETVGNVLTNFADGSGETFTVIPRTFETEVVTGSIAENGDLIIAGSTAVPGHTVEIIFSVIDERGAITESSQEIVFGARADDFLPGDTALELGSISAGIPETGSIERQGDLDRFVVELEAGQLYTIALDAASSGSGTLSDPEIFGLFDSLNNLIANTSDDDSGTGKNALVEPFTVAISGFYEIEVGSAQSYDTGDYTLTVESAGFVDDFLPGISADFGSVSIGGRATGEIETSGDVDGFRASLQANTTYEISILGRDSNNGTLVDPDLLGIFSSSDLSGTPISSVQTLNTQIVGDDSTSYFTPQNAGEYFIGVRDAFGGTGTYTVAVDDIGVRDDHSADVDTTGSIVAGGNAVGRVDFAQDIDWFEVNLSANRLYEISLVPLAGGNALSDPFFRGVYDSNGVLIGNTENDDGGTGTSSALQFVTDNAGTFYLAAGGFGNTTGQYRLELNDLGVLDNGRFDITIEYSYDDTPSSYIQAFEDAVERWEAIIVGDLPYANVEGYGYVDDILIEVAVVDIELVFEGVEQTILAISTVLDQRSDAGALPTYSRIVLNSEEIGELLNLDEFAQNTIGRALGFGSLWEEFGLVRDIDGVATYTGPNALREMAELYDYLDGQNVLEHGADGGLAAEYWSEGILDNELMTSRVELRRPWNGNSPRYTDNPISILTIAAMQDLGYQVNYDAADPYSIPPSRFWVSTGSGQQLRVTFSPENQSNNIIDIKPDENGEVLDDVIILTGDSEAPSEEKRQLRTIRFGASNETIDIDGNFGDDTVMNFTVAGVNDLTLKSLDTTNAGRASLTVDSTNHSGTLNATGGSPAIDGGVGTVLLKFVNDNDQAGSGGVDLEDGVSQYASVITFDDPGTSGEGENEFGIEYNVGDGETLPYAGVSSQALEDIDATMHDGVISLGVISEFSSEEFDLNAGATGQVFACLAIALDDGVAETPTLSATGTWNFDGSPGGYTPAGGLNNLDIEIKNIEIEPGGHLVFTHTDICITGHIDLSAAVLDIDAGSTVKVLPGGQLSLTVEQVNELQDVLQGVSVNIVSSEVDSPEISVAYNGTNIEDGDSSPSTGQGTDFGSQNYTSGSVTRTFRVSNTGVSILRLGAASSSSAEFSVSGLASSISGGSFDDFTVTFDPSSVGTTVATISFSTNDSDENPFNFTVIGFGTEPAATTWYSGAEQIQPAGWLYYDWFKGFKPEGPNWIYHGRHGWLYVIAEDTNGMFLWDVALGRWMYTNQNVYPWMYAYAGADAGWVFFFEGGRPGSRYFKRGDNGQMVSEQQLRVNP